MSDMKQFVTAVKEQVEEEPKNTVTFMHDAREVTATEPKPGQFAMWMAITGGYATEMDQAKGFIDFFIGLFADTEDKRYFSHRLMDVADDFDIDQIEDMIYWILEQFAERPTKPSSASTPALPQSGAGSTENSANVASTSSL